MSAKKCPYCNAELEDDVKKCRYCSEWLIDNQSDLPEELQCFNWGAFLLNWIWGIMHKKYITLLYFVAGVIPIIGPLAVSIWFGFEGNRWAFESRKWDSVEQFNEAQQNWVKVWFILAILGLIITVKVFSVIFWIAKV